MEDPVVLLERNLYGHPLAGLSWERQFENSYKSTVGRRFPNWECLFVYREKDYSYLCMWMPLNWLERNKILIRCGNYSTKKSIWENQHLSLIMYTWDALKDNVKSAKILDSDRTMFESRISAGGTELLPFLIFLFLHGLMTWWVMQRSVWSDIVS